MRGGLSLETAQRIRQVQGIVRRRDTPGSAKIASGLRDRAYVLDRDGSDPISVELEPNEGEFAPAPEPPLRDNSARRQSLEPTVAVRRWQSAGFDLSSASGGPRHQGDRTRTRSGERPGPKQGPSSCRLTDPPITCAVRLKGVLREDTVRSQTARGTHLVPPGRARVVDPTQTDAASGSGACYTADPSELQPSGQVRPPGRVSQT